MNEVREAGADQVGGFRAATGAKVEREGDEGENGGGANGTMTFAAYNIRIVKFGGPNVASVATPLCRVGMVQILHAIPRNATHVKTITLV